MTSYISKLFPRCALTPFPRSEKLLSEAALQVLGVDDEIRAANDWITISTKSLPSIRVPVYLDSPETLEFLELRNGLQIWSEFHENKIKKSSIKDSEEKNANEDSEYDRQYKFDFEMEDPEISLKAYIKSYVKQRSSELPSEKENHGKFFREIGLNDIFVKRLLDSAPRPMRLDVNPENWVYEMIDMKWRFLTKLDRLIIGSDSIERKPLKNPVDLTFSRMLYKAGILEELNSVFNFKVDGHGKRLNFDDLRTEAPSDFSLNFNGLYLTDNYQVALEQAQILKTLMGPVIKVGILHIPVELDTWQQPGNDDFMGPPTNYANLSVAYRGWANWNTFVWNNRHGPYHNYRSESPWDDEELPNLQWFDFLEGPICQTNTWTVLDKMDRPSDLAPWVIPLPGNVAEVVANQIFVKKEQAILYMESASASKVWITEVEGR